MRFERWGYFTILLAIILLPFVVLIHSCQHEGIPADQMEEICFTGEVLPVFQNSCATSGCHDAHSEENDYVFTDYAGIMKAITPGSAEKSKAYEAMTSAFEIMPPDNPLPASKRILIRLWIEQGAKETTCGDTPDHGTKSGTIWACYNRDIQPILMSSCAVSGCHDAATHKEGIDFSSYSKTLKAIKAGNPVSSELYHAITATPGTEHFMPPKPYSPLSKAAIDTIYSWIKRGALNEECASACDTTGTITYAGHIKSIIDRSCASCHGATNPSGGIKLLTAAEVQTVAKSGKLIGAVTRKAGFMAMPPAYALDNCDVRKIGLWINQGYN